MKRRAHPIRPTPQPPAPPVTARPGRGAPDRRFTPARLLRPDVDYDPPPGGGKALFDLAGDLSGRRILDFGCGRGPNRADLESRGARWIGLDLEGPGPRVIGDGLSLPFASGSFDGVLSVAVLEHLPEPDRALAEIRRVLAEGGTFFGYVAFLEPFHGISYFHMSHMGLEYLLLKHGFQPLRIFPSHWGPAYQIEHLLMPRHVPVIRPVLRFAGQRCVSALAWWSRMARSVLLQLGRRWGARNPEDRTRYRRLQRMRFATGFIFIARRGPLPVRLPDGYAALVRED